MSNINIKSLPANHKKALSLILIIAIVSSLLLSAIIIQQTQGEVFVSQDFNDPDSLDFFSWIVPESREGISIVDGAIKVEGNSKYGVLNGLPPTENLSISFKWMFDGTMPEGNYAYIARARDTDANNIYQLSFYKTDGVNYLELETPDWEHNPYKINVLENHWYNIDLEYIYSENGLFQLVIDGHNEGTVFMDTSFAHIHRFDMGEIDGSTDYVMWFDDLVFSDEITESTLEPTPEPTPEPTDEPQSDETAPIIGDIKISTQKFNTPATIKVNITDNIEVNGYIFSWNNTGTWTNSTWTTGSSITFVDTLNMNIGSVVGITIYANDTSNNWSSRTKYFTIVEKDTYEANLATQETKVRDNTFVDIFIVVTKNNESYSDYIVNITRDDRDFKVNTTQSFQDWDEKEATHQYKITKLYDTFAQQQVTNFVTSPLSITWEKITISDPNGPIQPTIPPQPTTEPTPSSNPIIPNITLPDADWNSIALFVIIAVIAVAVLLTVQSSRSDKKKDSIGNMEDFQMPKFR